LSEKRGSWHLLTGLIIGLVAGLLLSAWVIPVRYMNTDPSSLREEDKQKYRAVIAQSYLVEADLARARSRLDLLADPDQAGVLVAQAQNLLAAGGGDEQGARPGPAGGRDQRTICAGDPHGAGRGPGAGGWTFPRRKAPEP
jgi:hypothetical protein